MRVLSKNPFEQNGFFPLQDTLWLKYQRIAGSVAAKALNELEKEVKNKTKLSLIELNNLAERVIVENNCIPTFKNYKGFPASVCISINNQLVHGIPTDYHLQEGDLVTFDLGTTYYGAIADTAITCIYGNPKCDLHVKLINATYEALYKGIAAIAVNKHLGVIGNAIYKSAKGNGFSVITKYGGHGIGRDKNGNGILHDAPFIANRANPDDGVRIQPNFSLAIEPMLIIGDTPTYIDKSGWTVCGMDISAHFEHTVYIHETYTEVLTDRIIK